MVPATYHDLAFSCSRPEEDARKIIVSVRSPHDTHDTGVQIKDLVDPYHLLTVAAATGRAFSKMTVVNVRLPLLYDCFHGVKILPYRCHC